MYKCTLFFRKFLAHLYFLLLFEYMFMTHHFVCLFIIRSPEDSAS